MEDCEMMTTFLKGFLSKNYEVVTTNNAEDALMHLEEGYDPDALVIDYQLAETNSLNFLAAKTANYPDLPVIVLSGTKQAEVRVACLEAGAQDFLLKPFFPKELDLRLHNLLQNSARAMVPA
jgi:DNA-binding response OmpR family regulator